MLVNPPPHHPSSCLCFPFLLNPFPPLSPHQCLVTLSARPVISVLLREREAGIAGEWWNMVTMETASVLTPLHPSLFPWRPSTIRRRRIFTMQALIGNRAKSGKWCVSGSENARVCVCLCESMGVNVVCAMWVKKTPHALVIAGFSLCVHA